MSRILILESDKNVGEIFERAIAKGEIKDASIVYSVNDAVNVLKTGEVEVFRTNFINDGLPYGECRLYSVEAIREALAWGVKVEIGTVMTREEVVESFIDYDLESAFKDVIVVNKFREDYGLTIPGETESFSRNERL